MLVGTFETKLIHKKVGLLLWLDSGSQIIWKDTKLLFLSFKETNISLFFPSFFILPKLTFVFKHSFSRNNVEKNETSKYRRNRKKEHDSKLWENTS